jgi:rhodanese-related sulfurtransferase
MSQGLFAFLLIAMAVGAFAVTTLIEKRVNKASAPSREFKSRRHIAAGVGIFALGVIFIVMPDRKTSLINRVSDSGYVASHPVTMMDADELAFRIVDREPNIRIIDLRSTDTSMSHVLPGAEKIALRDLFGKEWIPLLSRRHLKKVIVGSDEAQERTAFLLLRELGYENLAVLKGGFEAFDKTILSSAPFVPTGSRWDADVKEFREKARGDILKLIAENKNKGAVGPKKTKKVQGGC